MPSAISSPENVAAPEDAASASHAQRVRGRRAWWPRTSSYRRLAGEILAAELRYEALVATVTARHGAPGSWATDMNRSLAAARSYLVTDVERGWRCLHQARHDELFGLAQRSREALESRITSLRSEADEKLRGHRKASALHTLDAALAELGSDEPDLTAATDLAYAASVVLHEHFENAHFKEGVLRENAYLLVAMLVVPLLAWGYLASTNPLDDLLVEAARAEAARAEHAAVANDAAVPAGTRPEAGAEPPPRFDLSLGMDHFARPHWFLLVSAAIFGVVGAALSGLRGVSAALFTRGATKIPDLLYARLLGFMQVGTGIGAGVLVYLLLYTNVLGLDESVTFSLFLFLCLVAGFAERFLVSRLEQFAGPPRGPASVDSRPS